MTLPPFGAPLLRACTCCGASNYLRSWRQRCVKCGELVVDLPALELLDRGVTVVVDEPKES